MTAAVSRKSWWSAASTWRGEEERAASHVERQGFQFYLPRVAELLESGRERRSLMFPGWIFFRVQDGWNRLAHTRGIRKLLLCDEQPTRVRDGDLDLIRSLEREDGLVHLTPRLRVGDEVRVAEGTYEGIVGTVKSLVSRDATKRVKVLMSMLGRPVVKEFDERQLLAR